MMSTEMTGGLVRKSPGRMVATGLVLAAAFFGLAPNSAQASGFQAGKTQLSSLAPEDCLLYTNLSGLSSWSEHLEKFDLYDLWQEPEVQAFVSDAVKLIPQLLQENMPPGNTELRTFTDLVQGRIEFVAGDLTMVAVENDVMPLPGMVLALDVGSNKRKFQGFLDQGLKEWARPEWFRKGEFKYRGVAVRTLSPPEKSREIPVFDLKICMAFVDNLFLVGLNPPYLKRIIDNRLDGASNTLANNSSFRRSVDKTGDSALAYTFVNIQGALSMFERLIPAEVKEICEDLGFGNVSSLYMGTGQEDGIATDVVYLDCPGKKTGLLKVLSLGSCSMKALKYAPENAFAFSSFNLDLNGAKNEIFGLLGKYVPEALEEVRREMAQAGSQIGLDIENDILGALTGEVSIVASMNPMGAMIPDVLLAFGVADEKKFSRLLEHGLAMTRGKVKSLSMDFKGEKIHYLRIPDAPVMPAYRLEDGVFLVTISPLMMKNIISSTGSGQKGLASVKDFQAALKSCGGSPSVFSYVDGRHLVGYAYNTIMPLVQGAVPQEVPVDMALLPTSDVVVKHLSAETFVYTNDQDGLLMKSRSCVGTSFFLCLASRLIDAYGDIRVPTQGMGMGNPSYTQHSEHHGESTSTAHAVETQERGHEAPRYESRKSAPKETSSYVVKAEPKESSAGAPSIDEAMGIYQSGNLEAAIEAFSHVLKADPTSGQAYFFRGYSQYQLKNYEEFTRNSRKAAENGFQTGTAFYNTCCGYSLLKKKGPALKYLKKAIENGFTDYDHMRADSDLEFLRGEDEFKSMMKGVN